MPAVDVAVETNFGAKGFHISVLAGGCGVVGNPSVGQHALVSEFVATVGAGIFGIGRHRHVVSEPLIPDDRRVDEAEAARFHLHRHVVVASGFKCRSLGVNVYCA